jgi:hypothetical protein
MLSTSYRLRIESICNKIINGETVELSEVIWAEKLSKSNRTAAEMLRKARRISIQGKGKEGSLDEFLQIMDLGNPDPREHRTGFDGPDDIADFFRNGDGMRRD